MKKRSKMALVKYGIFLFKQNLKFSPANILVKDQNIINSVFLRTNTSQPIEYDAKQNPAPFYFNEKIQFLLKQLTRVNLNKVFRHKRLETKQLETPTYKFMTDEDLKEVMEDATERANEMLQMPPVVKVREPIEEVLSRDAALQGYDTAKFVFTDITYGMSDRERLVVIREPNGNLVKADWDTRQRVNQIYFPQAGREIHTPKMFNDDYLKNLLERKEYEFVLDRACVQFEPDDPVYQKITSLTYQHLNDNSEFEILRSTRHFGPLVFFLAWNKLVDNLLLDLIQTSHIEEANYLIMLYNKIHDKHFVESESVSEKQDDTTIIENFIAENSSKKGQLELALQSYKELLKNKLEIEMGIKKAHGLSQ